MLFTVIICVTNFFDRVKDKRPRINTGTFVWDKVIRTGDIWQYLLLTFGKMICADLEHSVPLFHEKF